MSDEDGRAEGDAGTRDGEVSRAVLITGCSSGIGRATAERLASAGWRVYATLVAPRQSPTSPNAGAGRSPWISPMRNR